MQEASPKPASAPGTPQETRERLLKIEGELNAEVYERAEEVRSMILCLLVGEHVLLLGPPGTAKSQLSRALCDRVQNATYFSCVLNRASMPDEVFGPTKLSALREDRFERNTALMLPEAEIAFIDEVFKSNSAILNGMLPILNERIHKNGGSWNRVPLQLAVAASNEMPEDREELGALYDRLLVRHLVGRVKERANFRAIVLRTNQQNGAAAAPAIPTTVSLPELLAAREEALRVDLSPVADALDAIDQELAEEGIEPSVRRFDKACDLARANAFLDGRARANDEDLAPMVHALWEEPDQIPKVREKILGRANPFLAEAQDLADEAGEVARVALAAEDPEMATRGTEANAKLRIIKDKLLEIRSRAASSGRKTAAIDAALADVKAKNEEVLRRCLGVD